MGENVKASIDTKTNGNIRNKIYFSKRLREKMNLIPFCAITTVVAPTGYGKSTAMRTFFKEKREAGEKIFWLSLHGGESTLFWRRVSALMKEYPSIQKILDSIGTPETAYEKQLFLEAFLQLADSEDEIYFVVDNFHLLDFTRANNILTVLKDFIPDNFHLIVISRINPLKGSQRIAFGARINEIGSGHLSLTEEEIGEYATLCDVKLKTEDKKALFEESEGWISIIYMNLLNYIENKELLLNYNNIYPMVRDIFYQPLKEKTKDILIKLSLTSEGDFTKEQAVVVCSNKNVLEELEHVSREDNFIYYSDNTGFYHIHNILLQILKKEYEELSDIRKSEILIQYGIWFEKEGEIEKTIRYYHEAGSYERLLQILIKYQSHWQGQESAKILSDVIKEASRELLLSYPEALIISMRRFILFKMEPEREKVQELLRFLMLEAEDIREEKRIWIKGEYEASRSLFKFNDIEEMGACQKRGWELLGKQSTTLDVENMWTQGSPSILLSYYRNLGELDKIVDAIYEAMPTYHKLTGGHGKGAAYLLDSEAHYLRGDFEISMKLAQRAEAEAKEYNQWSIVVNSKLIILKCRMFTEGTLAIEDLFGELYGYLKDKGHLNLLFKVEIEEAYINSINNSPEKMQWIPTIDNNSKLPYLGALPSIHLAYNQYLICTGNYQKVLALEEKNRALFNKFHIGYGQLALDIQLASVHLLLADEAKAFEYLDKAMKAGEADKLIMPYAEAYYYIAPLLSKATDGGRYDNEVLQKIKEIGERLYSRGSLRGNYEKLSLKEQEIAEMAAMRYTNKEIGERLFLSAGTVKQYMNRIYNKVGIEGEAKNKKSLLRSYINNH